MTNQVTAFKHNQDIPQDMLLGFLSFNHLDKDIHITKDDLVQKFKDEGLDRYVSELELKDHDVFRRATSHYQNFKLLDRADEKKKLMIRELESNNEQITRVLVKEHVIKGQSEPEYETVGSISLLRDTGTLNYNVKHNASDYDYMSLLSEMSSSYQTLRQYHNKETVSNLVSRIITSLRPVNIIPNGRAKFIPAEHNETLYSLQKVVRSLSAESTVELIPLIDTNEQRDLVHKGITKQTETDLNAMIFEISQILSGKAEMTSRKYQSFQKRMKELEETVDYYENILSRKSLIHQGLGQLRKQLMTVQQ